MCAATAFCLIEIRNMREFLNGVLHTDEESALTTVVPAARPPILDGNKLMHSHNRTARSEAHTQKDMVWLESIVSVYRSNKLFGLIGTSTGRKSVSVGASPD